MLVNYKSIQTLSMSQPVPAASNTGAVAKEAKSGRLRLVWYLSTNSVTGVTTLHAHWQTTNIDVRRSYVPS